MDRFDKKDMVRSTVGVVIIADIRNDCGLKHSESKSGWEKYRNWDPKGKWTLENI